VNAIGSMTITSVQCFTNTGTISMSLSLNGAGNFLSPVVCSVAGSGSVAINQAFALSDKLNFVITQADGVAQRATVAITAFVN
jgi:hypothetical protein